MAGPEGAGGAGRATTPPPEPQDLEARAEQLTADIARLEGELRTARTDLDIEREVDPDSERMPDLERQAESLERRVRSKTRELEAVEAALEGNMEPLERVTEARETAQTVFNEIWGDLSGPGSVLGDTPDQGLAGVTGGVGSEPRGTGAISPQPQSQRVPEGPVRFGTLEIGPTRLEGYVANEGAEPREGYRALDIPGSANSRQFFVAEGQYPEARAAVNNLQRGNAEVTFSPAE